MAHNGLLYETLGISELRPYQPISTLPARGALALPFNPQFIMTACFSQCILLIQILLKSNIIN